MTNSARRILIVDDDGLVRENVVLFCERLGFDVTSCATLASAMSHASTGQFGVVLADCFLPDGNGMKILEEVSQSHPETSIVMMTGFPSIEAVIRSLRLGAVDYVIKPFNLYELKTILERAAQKHTYALSALEALRVAGKVVSGAGSPVAHEVDNRRSQIAEPEFANSGVKY